MQIAETVRKAVRATPRRLDALALRRFGRWLWFSVPALILGVAIAATIDDAPELWDDGGWFALLGNVMAVAGTLVLLITGAILVLAVVVGPPMMVYLQSGAARAETLIAWLDDHGLDATTVRLVKGVRGKPDTWDPVFGDFLEFGAGRRDNIATLMQLAAYPLAIVVLLALLKLIQWLA